MLVTTELWLSFLLCSAFSSFGLYYSTYKKKKRASFLTYIALWVVLSFSSFLIVLIFKTALNYFDFKYFSEMIIGFFYTYYMADAPMFENIEKK